MRSIGSFLVGAAAVGLATTGPGKALIADFGKAVIAIVRKEVIDPLNKEIEKEKEENKDEQ